MSKTEGKQYAANSKILRQRNVCYQFVNILLIDAVEFQNEYTTQKQNDKVT